MLLNFQYMIEGHIWKMRYVDLDNGFIRESQKYEIIVLSVVETDRPVSSGNMKISILLVYGEDKEKGGQWVAKVLLLIRIGVNEGKMR